LADPWWLFTIELDRQPHNSFLSSAWRHGRNRSETALNSGDGCLVKDGLPDDDDDDDDDENENKMKDCD